jgi:DNA-binding NarL/FixJ family response regulator
MQVVVMGMEQRIKLFVIDDEELSRTGFCLLFAKDERIELVGNGETLSDSLPAIESCRPDVIVVKAQVTGEQIAAPIEELLKRCPQVHVLAVLELLDPDLIARLIKDGVSGICSVRINVESLLLAIHATASGSIWFGPRVSDVIRNLVSGSANAMNDQAHRSRLLAASLTERESEILKLMSRGLTNQQIAGELHLSVETVKTYIRRIMDKSAIRTRRQLLNCMPESQTTNKNEGGTATPV